MKESILHSLYKRGYAVKNENNIRYLPNKIRSQTNRNFINKSFKILHNDIKKSLYSPL